MAENQNVLGGIGEGEAASVEAGHHAHDASSAHDHHSDTTTVRFAGREITLPVPVYTAVFGALGVLTIIEVLLAEIITTDIKTPILVLLSLMKAALVVWFYMHLNRDTRIFMLTLLLPVIVGLLSALYLLSVPTGYSY